MYITAPRITQTISTKNTNTAIFARLALSALIRLLDSPTYRASFKILNTRINRNALKAINECDPSIKKDKYLGIVDNKSTTP